MVLVADQVDEGVYLGGGGQLVDDALVERNCGEGVGGCDDSRRASKVEQVETLRAGGSVLLPLPPPSLVQTP
jgi:hypothetical protein